jgi:uncharacterized protein YdhG (YjbR/CyaY superfamily)
MATTQKTTPYGLVKFDTIDAYHAAQPATVQPFIQQLRQIIRKAAPAAVETISYNMPAFKQHTNLVYYAVHKKHVGLYPTNSPIQFFAEELGAFTTSKGAIQLPLDKPLPVALIKKIVQFRVAEDVKKAAAKKQPVKRVK